MDDRLTPLIDKLQKSVSSALGEDVANIEEKQKVRELRHANDKVIIWCDRLALLDIAVNIVISCLFFYVTIGYGVLMVILTLTVSIGFLLYLMFVYKPHRKLKIKAYDELSTLISLKIIKKHIDTFGTTLNDPSSQK